MDNVNENDKEQLIDNIMDIIDKVEDLMDLNDILHFVNEWTTDHDMSVNEARDHLCDCVVCRDLYQELIADTQLRQASLSYGRRRDHAPRNVPYPVQHLMDF